MWLKRTMNTFRLKCLLIILGLNLPQGLSQNAEPGGSATRSGLGGPTLEHRYNGSILTTNSSGSTSATMQQPLNPWETFPKGSEAVDERKDLLTRNSEAESETMLRAMSNKEDKEASSSSTLFSGGRNSSRGIDSAATFSTPPSSRRKSRGKGGERRRRLKQYLALISHERESNATSSEKLGAASSGPGIRGKVNVELNTVQRPKEDRLNTHRGRASSRRKASRSNPGRDKKLKEAKERRKKQRMERRRRRTREKRRRNKLHYDSNQGKGRRTRKQKQLRGQPASLFMGTRADSESNVTKLALEKVRPDVVFTEPVDLRGSSVESSNESSTVKEAEPIEKYLTMDRKLDGILIPESNHGREIPGVEHDKENSSIDRGTLTEHRDLRENNVEREFSKQFERELWKSRRVDERGLLIGQDARMLSPTASISPGSLKAAQYPDKNLEDSRFAGEKILGYSSSENKLPSLDDVNDEEASSKNFKYHSDYITDDLRLSKFPSSRLYSMHSLAKLRSNSFVEDSNISGLMAGDHPTLLEDKQRAFENFSKQLNDTSNKGGHANSEETGAGRATETADWDNLKGDLSCINGTFLPAPLAHHALIKYVKSSTPGHEYLEADYECTLGYYMASKTRRLLCNNRRWMGVMPKCKPKRSLDDVCADSSCEQVCREVNGGPICACYKGFRQEGNRCIDINECEKGNGGCEFSCLNTPGSYHCECPKGMKQGENRYTCMDINECLLNNGHGPCQDTCHNLEGSYRCSCESLPGTTLAENNHTCRDAGPCGINNAGCSHTCLSTMGRVFCLCPDGFMLEDDWKTCQDVDECAVPDLQSVVCQHGCINTPGSYRCAEPPEMQDEPPSNLLSKGCNPGFESSVNGVCVDVDECALSNGGCLEVCENTVGSYFCACDGDERLLSGDGKTCVEINDVACPALNPSGRGYVMCSRLTTPKLWRGRKRVINRPGTKCFLRCPYGYQLRGEYELTCGTNGNWLGSRHGECVRYSKPRLDCPPNLIVEVPPGQPEAFVTFAQPSTDLDWFRYVRSEPSWGTRLEANLVLGEHTVTFIAKHPVSKKQATCTLHITVKPGEAPRIKNCPNDILTQGTNGTMVTWTDPIFMDNVKIAKVISNKNPGHFFSVGEHKVHYEASDEAGWTATCDFLVTVRAD